MMFRFFTRVSRASIAILMASNSRPSGSTNHSPGFGTIPLLTAEVSYPLEFAMSADGKGPESRPGWR
jgi:hypothetical protein